METLQKIEKEMETLTYIVETHIIEGAVKDTEIVCKIEDIFKKLEKLDDSIVGLVTVWEQAQGILTFIKWLVGISGSVVAILAYFKGIKG